LISRMVYESPQLFMHALEKMPSTSTLPNGFRLTKGLSSTEATMKWLLEEWLTHVDEITDPSRRKLMVLALTKAIDLPQDIIVPHMQSLFGLWTTVILELTEDVADKSCDYLVQNPNQYPPGFEVVQISSPDGRRRQSLDSYDPVGNVNLIEYVRAGLSSFIHRCGGEVGFQNQVLVNIDRVVIEGFARLGIM